MTKALSIQLKAYFLLFIFSSNIMVGFACAIGIDMGFNTRHHQEAESTEIHDHADGQKHHHEGVQTELPDHADNNKHHHDAGYEHSPINGKDGCCKDIVLKISKADKAVPQTIQLSNKIMYVAFVPVSYSFAELHHSPIPASSNCFFYGHHPPIADIRIAIRSFQI